ncbi:MAG: hypothetical protein JWN48_3342 [Myxococcaceae bacterium]|nr:hypothetical protein [Myxococcaceae bacterium]
MRSNDSSLDPDSTVPPFRSGNDSAGWLLGLTLGVATLVGLVGWTTDLRDVMHGALLAVCVVAFLPFVIIAAGLGVLLAALLILALVGVIGGEAPDVSGMYGAAEGLGAAPRGIRTYYALLARHGRSRWMGIPAGMLLGALVLWAGLAISVLPREAKTSERLLVAQSFIERSYEESKHYPSATTSGQLPAIVDENGATLEPIDAFGRPLLYETRGRWKWQSYRVSSLGYDGVRSADDLCVGGQTKLQELVDRAALLKGLSAALRFTESSWQDRLQRIHSLQCEAQR